MLTPLHLEIVLWYHSRAEDMPNLHAPAVREFLAYLIQAQMIEMDSSETNRTYRTTERAEAWLDYLLNVPLPEKKWVMRIVPPAA